MVTKKTKRIKREVNIFASLAPDASLCREIALHTNLGSKVAEKPVHKWALLANRWASGKSELKRKKSTKDDNGGSVTQ